jgi:ABC-2 type transport system permease protein
MGAEAEAVLRRSARTTPWSRLIGLASVYAKTVRDSRRAALVVGLLGGGFMLATAAPYGTEFTTPLDRQMLVAQMTSLPTVLRGLLGDPINIETLGGFLSWRVGNVLPVMLGLWSVLALSGTLAGEAARGSLDLVVATPVGRRSIAIQKVAGHVTALVAAMLIAAVFIVIAGRTFAVLPGDEIFPDRALGQIALYGLLILAAGSMSFAAAPFLGRTRALALGFIFLFGGYLIASYSSLSPMIEVLRPLSWYAWTAGHRPIAGVTDWASLGVLALVCLVLLAVGVVGFARRDIGATAVLSWLRLPSLPAGVGGPLRRQLADRTSVAIAWGLGVGLYASLIAASAPALSDTLTELPQMADLIKTVYPNIDLGEPSGILQLAFFGFAALLIGLAAASFVAAWADDETGGRLAMVMAAPVARARWVLMSGLGVMAAIGVTVIVLGVVVALAVASLGGDVATPVIGIAILGLSAAGFAGIGLAAGGLLRAALAAPVTAAVVIATFLLDTLGTALDLPDFVLDLSIYRHLGQPMVGTYEPAGIAASAILAVGGLALGAWGLQRRDLDR